jgi:cytochrome c oxidase subunit 2
MIENWVPAISSFAGDIDFVFDLVFWIVVAFWFFLVEGVFLWLILRFRKKDGVKAQYITGELKSEKNWVHYPHLLVLACDVVILAAAIHVWYDVKQNVPPTDETVRIVGQQWAWSFVHAGADGRLDTADDIKTVDDLHLEVGKTYAFKLESRDVLHSFSVPVFRLKQDVIPGRVITGWFQATQTGTFDIQCAEICGIGHALMPARIVIETEPQHTAWMASQSPLSVAALESPRAAQE